MKLLHRATDGPEFIRARFGTSRGLVRLWLSQAAHVTGRLRQSEHIDWERVSRLVFVCHGNICRSAYAEKRTLLFDYPTASFGLNAASGLPADKQAQATALQRGVDLRSHRSCSVADFTIRSGDLLVAMEIGHLDKIVGRFGTNRGVQYTLMGLWAHPSRPHLHDPHGLSATYFEACFNIIDSSINTVLPKLKG